MPQITLWSLQNKTLLYQVFILLREQYNTIIIIIFGLKCCFLELEPIGGNFHGEYPAKALDYLAIAVSEIGSISERRIERLINPSSSGLPAFLVKEGGLNSGFMIAHCTAAALVSENKVLSHPSSVDSIPTSAGKEDHVSMGGWSARKARKVKKHTPPLLT